MSTATATEIEAPEVATPELDVSDLSRVDGARVLRAIARNCVAVKVSCHGIGYERKINGADVSVEGERVPDNVLSGATCRLVPPEVHKAVNSIANQARKLPGRFGTSFPGGAYLVPVHGAGGRNPAAELFGAVRACRQEYQDRAAEFRPRWEEHVAHMRNNEPHWYEKLRRWLVDGDTFVARHTIDMMLMPLGAGLPVDFNSRARSALRELISDPSVPQADFDALNRLLPQILEVVARTASAPAALLGEDASQAWVREANVATSRAVAEAVQTMIQQPLTEFAEALANMEGIIDRGSNVRDGTIDKVRRAYNKLTGFSFLATPELQRRLQEFSGRLENLSPQRVNGSSNADRARNLSSFFREVREELVAEDTHAAAYGQFMRGLDL